MNLKRKDYRIVLRYAAKYTKQITNRLKRGGIEFKGYIWENEKGEERVSIEIFGNFKRFIELANDFYTFNGTSYVTLKNGYTYTYEELMNEYNDRLNYLKDGEQIWEK